MTSGILPDNEEMVKIAKNTSFYMIYNEPNLRQASFQI